MTDILKRFFAEELSGRGDPIIANLLKMERDFRAMDARFSAKADICLEAAIMCKNSISTPTTEEAKGGDV